MSRRQSNHGREPTLGLPASGVLNPPKLLSSCVNVLLQPACRSKAFLFLQREVVEDNVVKAAHQQWLLDAQIQLMTAQLAACMAQVLS